MSREVLNDPAPRAGFFGKLPLTGDFVARGLPATFRRHWDAWITRHVAACALPLPQGGLRFRLTSGGRAAAGVILDSADSAGRSFPLTLVLIGQTLPAPPALDPWCDGALEAARLAREGRATADDLIDALDAVPLPAEPGTAGVGMLLWSRVVAAARCDPSNPARVLHRVLRLSCC